MPDSKGLVFLIASPWDMESADAQPTSVGRMSSGLI
jgi:hypothetical protein